MKSWVFTILLRGNSFNHGMKVLGHALQLDLDHSISTGRFHCREDVARRQRNFDAALG